MSIRSVRTTIVAIALLALAGAATAATVTIGDGEYSTNQPFRMNQGYSRAASIYKQSEVGSHDWINELAWRVSVPQTAAAPIKIYLKTTADTGFASGDTWANVSSGATLVYDGSLSFPGAGWQTVDITDYNYTQDHLMVLCEMNYGGSGAGVTPEFYSTIYVGGSYYPL